ncbi:MAG: hypothetical protein COU10_04070 [Candidatus Harrisonbacteria bacterium CG10_big_fil_rev_8_21_14_0_10_45_28]|uniref:Vitamin K epoxide reductase domain-containing protein n=1 Tax=Candidatus Harrisonbacteria bacterium CG10_big_fil_rev_8_21_14_0_10_45_28 TaxID=1974586 RepID=A0A2H0UMC1_9BACT|nr:MAG: hypothetical protein COU10_04070 [Candidatus Harrisonbacteria bacterium CG10_big_fil_rev_8_21_14_0_10_45_28]
MTTPLWLILILSFLGIVNTAHLAKHSISKTDVECIGFPKAWCHKVQYSKFSKTLGIPNPHLGLIMYVAIFVLALLFVFGLAPYAYTMIPVALLIIIGFLFSLYFTIIQAFILHAFCTWCIISAVEFTLLAAAILVYGI